MKIYKEFSTGLYVKDCAKGIGTVTYYQLNTGKFCLLNFNMVDDDLDISDGSLYSASIKVYKENRSYNIGEKLVILIIQSIGEIEVVLILAFMEN